MAITSDYSIWMIEYAKVQNQVSEAVYSGYARSGETIYFPFSFVLVRGGGRNILIDCGIDFASEAKTSIADGFGVEARRSPAEVLERVGLTPDDIDVVIPTHAHWDHMGALGQFPNATVYIQRGEWEGWRQLLKKSEMFAGLLTAVDSADIDVLTKIQEEGRLVVLDGEVENLLPGIHIWTDLNGHSHASQLVLIEGTREGKPDNFIVVGDVAYSLDNLTGVPEYPHFIPNTKWAIGGEYSTMLTYERVLSYVGDDLFRVLIEHDYKTWERFPTVEFEDGLHVAEVRLSKLTVR